MGWILQFYCLGYTHAFLNHIGQRVGMFHFLTFLAFNFSPKALFAKKNRQKKQQGEFNREVPATEKAVPRQMSYLLPVRR